MAENIPDINNSDLNTDIQYLEVDKVVQNLKNNKATGIDSIPNEILKNNNVIHALTRYFNLCFSYSKVPSIWLKAVISP